VLLAQSAGGRPSKPAFGRRSAIKRLGWADIIMPGQTGLLDGQLPMIEGSTASNGTTRQLTMVRAARIWIIGIS